MPSCQPPKSIIILEDNIINCLDLLPDKEDISLKASNHGKKRIRSACNNNDNIRLANIDQQRPTTRNWTSQNRLLNESSQNFREITFSKSKFPLGIPVLNTRYKHLESQNNNPFYLFNDQLNYTLANYFAELETIKCNINKFLSNLLMKPITKKLSYCNINKSIEKLFAIL